MNDEKHIARAGLELIKNFEGYLTRLPDGGCRAYLDTLVRPQLRSKGYGGLWTIGWGSTGPHVTEGTTWSRKQAEEDLLRLIRSHEESVKSKVKVELTQNQFDAITSLSYNMGLGKANGLLSKLNRGDYEGAADAFLMYNQAGGVVRRGLVRRREAERALFLNPSQPETVPQASRKLRILERLRLFLAGLGITWAGVESFASDMAQWAHDHSTFVAIGLGVTAWLVFKWVEKESVKDYEEGRYLPSGYANE